MPPNACDSPMVMASLPPRRLVAIAVRPNFAVATVMCAADSRRSRSKPVKSSSASGSLFQSRSFAVSRRTVEM